MLSCESDPNAYQRHQYFNLRDLVGTQFVRIMPLQTVTLLYGYERELKLLLRPGQSPATRRAARRSHFSSFPFFSGFCFRNPGFFRTISGDGGQTTCRCEETEEEKTKISKTTGFFKKKLKTRATSDAARRASRAKTRPESGDEKQARRDARR